MSSFFFSSSETGLLFPVTIVLILDNASALPFWISGFTVFHNLIPPVGFTISLV